MLHRPRLIFSLIISLLLLSLLVYFTLHDDGSWTAGVRKTMNYYEVYENSGDASFGCREDEFITVADAQYYTTESSTLEACSFHSRTLELVAGECNYRKWCSFAADKDVFFEELCSEGGIKKLEVHFNCYHCPPDFYFIPGKGCFKCPIGLYAEAGTNRFCKAGYGHGSEIMGQPQEQQHDHHHH